MMFWDSSIEMMASAEIAMIASDMRSASAVAAVSSGGSPLVVGMGPNIRRIASPSRRLPWLRALEQTRLQSKTHQLGAMRKTKLLHHATAIRIDRLGRDEQLSADLARAESLNGLLENIALAVGQLLEWIR